MEQLSRTARFWQWWAALSLRRPRLIVLLGILAFVASIPGAARLYGYSAAEAVGRPISIIIPPDHPNELLRVLARLKRGEHIQPYETARLRKDGTRVQVSLAISPLRSPSGAVKRLFGRTSPPPAAAERL